MDTTTDHGRLACEHQAVTDALHRYTDGLDSGDRAVLASAFSEDAVFDLTPAAARIGFEFTLLRGRDAIVDALIRAVGAMDTSHATSNIRVAVAGDTATLSAYLAAQHYPPGQGPLPKSTRHSLFMNRYEADLVRDGDRWCLSRVVIDNLWFDGDLELVLRGDGDR